jgi:hypothetical protein
MHVELSSNDINHELQIVLEAVYQTMLQLCNDSNATVKAMSLYALGNFISALRESFLGGILGTTRLVEICSCIIVCLGDDNEKVTGNAIRCIGHASSLLSQQISEGGNKNLSNSCDLLSRVVISLADKLSNTLDVALDEDKKSALTWKQRSAAKKHGWGACHSLATVFQGFSGGAVAQEGSVVTSCCEAFQRLILCQKHFRSLNEKVVVAAMTAISELPTEIIIQFGGKGCLGDAITNSLLILCERLGLEWSNTLSNQDGMSDKVVTQNQIVLLHLLRSATISDAFQVISDERVTAQELDVFYMWMVDQKEGNVDAHAFEIFALALQRPGQWSEDVTLEQRFASRALQKYKDDHKGVGKADMVRDTHDHDDADEL